jgi:hypothetical protein
MTELWYLIGIMSSIKKATIKNGPFKTTLYLPDNLHSELKIQAAKLRTSMTKLIIQAIQNELKKPSKKSKGRKL